MNPNDHGPALTLDQVGRLVVFLAERGHHDVALQILGGIAWDVAMVALSKAQAA